jgi:hypothetical protein
MPKAPCVLLGKRIGREPIHARGEGEQYSFLAEGGERDNARARARERRESGREREKERQGRFRVRIPEHSDSFLHPTSDSFLSTSYLTSYSV